MRLIFMGTPDFSVPALDALVAAGHEIAAVYCQPPRPAGRGQKDRPSPVQARAAALGLPVRHPKSLKSPEEQAAFAALGADLIVRALEQVASGQLHATPQPAQGVTYAHKIEKAESAVDWSLPATVIGQRIRAFDPFPGASTVLGGEVIKLWCCEIDSCSRPSGAASGQILSVDSAGVTVACGDGALRLTTLQRAGGKRLAAADFLRGFALEPGMVLGAGPEADAHH